MTDPKHAIDIDADIQFNTPETAVKIHIESLNGVKLSPQDVLDSVVDLLMTYYGLTQEDWQARVNEGMDS